MLPRSPRDAISGSSSCLCCVDAKISPDFANMTSVYSSASIAAVPALFTQLILAVILPTNRGSVHLAKRIIRPSGLDCTLQDKEALTYAFDAAPIVVSLFKGKTACCLSQPLTVIIAH
jgi:hypothetical protein